MKILLVEDDDDLREVVARSLRRERYIVETAADCATARMKVGAYEYDCLLIDIMLPDGNGLDLLAFIAARHISTNVIILSAKDSTEDKVTGLNLGADDYLAKPFHLAELHARIKSVARRRRGGDTLCIGNICIRPDVFSVEVDGRPLALGRKEYDLLCYLAGRPSRLLSKQMIAEAVWGDYADGADNFDAVYTHIKNLRRRLRAAGSTAEITTVYGFGYKLTATT